MSESTSSSSDSSSSSSASTPSTPSGLSPLPEIDEGEIAMEIDYFSPIDTDAEAGVEHVMPLLATLCRSPSEAEAAGSINGFDGRKRARETDSLAFLHWADEGKAKRRQLEEEKSGFGGELWDRAEAVLLNEGEGFKAEYRVAGEGRAYEAEEGLAAYGLRGVEDGKRNEVEEGKGNEDEEVPSAALVSVAERSERGRAEEARLESGDLDFVLEEKKKVGAGRCHPGEPDKIEAHNRAIYLAKSFGLSNPSDSEGDGTEDPLAIVADKRRLVEAGESSHKLGECESEGLTEEVGGEMFDPGMLDEEWRQKTLALNG